VCLGFCVCVTGAAASVSALGRPHAVPSIVLWLVAIAFALLTAVLVRVAVRFEHGLRAAQAGSPRPAVTRKVPKNGPVARAIAVIVVVGMFAFLVFLSVSLHNEAQQSAETQHHGLARTGRVTRVETESHATKYDSWTTYDYDLALAAPVGHTERTTADDPTRDEQNYSVGDAVRILVDPHHPSYAEFPGEPVEASTWWVGPLIIGGLFGFVGVMCVVEEVKHRRARVPATTPTMT
jgi:hypothetical protein